MVGNKGSRGDRSPEPPRSSPVLLTEGNAPYAPSAATSLAHPPQSPRGPGAGPPPPPAGWLPVCWVVSAAFPLPWVCGSLVPDGVLLSGSGFLARGQLLPHSAPTRVPAWGAQGCRGAWKLLQLL